MMTIDHPDFERYQHLFESVAEQLEEWTGPRTAVGCAELVLCLYGDNGLAPEEEFALLEHFQHEAETTPHALAKVTIEADCWLERILFKPANTVMQGG